jgi:hypothetical protein
MANQTKRSIFNLKDLRGGYATDLIPDLMTDNEMLQAKNVWWRSGLKKRGGVSKYASFTGSLRGAIRVYEEDSDSWQTVYAVDDGSTVEFQSAASDTLVTITGASLTATTTSTAPFTVGKDVEFDALGGKIIAVNGTDRAYAIWASGSSTFYGMDLDRYDERSRSTDNWFAGQYDGSGTTYTDDTTDAQTTTGTFLLASSTYTNGWYAAGDFTYSKLIFAGVDPGANGSASGTYQYYGGASGAETWTAIGTFNSTFVNTSGTQWGTGTVIGEWELPLSTDGTLKWKKYDQTEGNLTNRYVIRSVFSGLSEPMVSDKIEEMTHTHYLTQITGDQKPQAVRTHRNHMFLAANNQVQIGIANSIKGWRADRWEYFFEDDNEVKRMETLNNYLVIIKGGRMFAIDGTSWQNWSVRPLGEGGIVSRRGAVVANGVLWMVDRDGIWMFDGNVHRKVSKHIQSDIDGLTLTDANMYFYKTDVMVSFPSNDTTLIFDPDTIRRDDMGDGRVSFQKWTPYYARQIIHNRGGGDDGNLILLGTNYTGRGDYLDYDEIEASLPIDMRIQTKLFQFGGEETYKNFARCKAKVGNVSAPAAAEYEFKFLTEDASNSAIITTAVGTGSTSQDISVPYTMDGKLISMYIRHNTKYAAKVDTISVDTRERRY